MNFRCVKYLDNSDRIKESRICVIVGSKVQRWQGKLLKIYAILGANFCPYFPSTGFSARKFTTTNFVEIIDLNVFYNSYTK